MMIHLNLSNESRKGLCLLLLLTVLSCEFGVVRADEEVEGEITVLGVTMKKKAFYLCMYYLGIY